MQEEAFRNWLAIEKGLSETSTTARTSICRRVERHEGDLDAHWDADGLQRLLDRLTYSRDDLRNGRPPAHGIEIDGDVYSGTITLKAAVASYGEFRYQSDGIAQGDTLVTQGSADLRPCWFVGAAFDGWKDQTDRFLRDGVWENGHDDRYLNRVKSIEPGDRIAIKSAYTKKRGLPFDNRGVSTSTMAIKATGIVTKNMGDGRKLLVDWTPMEPPREWYFFVYQPTPLESHARFGLAGSRLDRFHFRRSGTRPQGVPAPPVPRTLRGRGSQRRPNGFDRGLQPGRRRRVGSRRRTPIRTGHP